MNQASPRIKFALFCATKIDNRKINLTHDQAADFLTRANNGEKEAVRAELMAMGGESKGAAPSSKEDYQNIFDAAHKAGMEAASAHTPTPMTVCQRANPLDDSSTVVKAWAVSSGACGFAWINVRDARKGFAKWLLGKKLARKDSYYGGVCIWVSDFGQSIELKEKYAYAFAKVLAENKIDSYASSRMD